MYLFSFEKLSVWNDSKEFIKLIYDVCKSFPDSEKFGLKSQLQRASVSIASNIAEGNSRMTPKDKAYFTTIAYSSLMEVLNQIIISHELGFIEYKKYLEIRDYVYKISNKLNALKKHQLNC